MATRVYEYTVRGTGEFPFDMLRYDRAWPSKEFEMGSLSTRHMNLDEMLTPRVVSMHGLIKPTEARWKSFGWTVNSVRECK